MPNIKLTQKELDYLRTHYEYELDEATTYVKQLKSIIRKLDAADMPTVVKPIPAAKVQAKPTGKKRGRPAKAKAEIPVKVEEPKPKVKRGRPKKVKVESKKVLPEDTPVIPAEKTVVVAEPVKAAIAPVPKPKRKRTSHYRSQGVFLQNMSKPLPKVPKDDIGLPYGSNNIITE